MAYISISIWVLYLASVVIFGTQINDKHVIDVNLQIHPPAPGV